MVNQIQWKKKALAHVLSQRKKALVCTVCKMRLFNFDNCINEYVKCNFNKWNLDLTVSREICLFVFDNYPFHGQDKMILVRHHTNYKKGITIPVCDICHQKIHKSNDSRFIKYLPVDERPKDIKKIVYNLYDVDKLIEKKV